MPIQCPKCGHVRSPNETAPDWECPACGIVYAKYRAPAARAAVPQPATAPRIPTAPARTPLTFRKVVTVGSLILFVPMLIWAMVMQHKTQAALADHGQIATARVVRLEFKKNQVTGAQSSYMGEAHFATANNPDATARVSLPDELAHSMQQGGSNVIQIRYLPETPTIAELVESEGGR
jgi:predicted  nucleic acid-binding Zn-ribbon protein